MKTTALKFWYFLWKMTASLGLRMYFSSMQVLGLENVPPRGPIILAVNHQNSFLDAIIVACVLKRKSYFLARGDVFRKRWAYALLSSLGIMPIFRSRDGLEKVRGNASIFEACSQILSKGGAVMIFPEGNHYMRWSMRPLQRGLARIAFQAQEVHAITSIKIVPVGLQYEAHTKAASRILVQLGEPLEADTYAATDDADSRTKMDLLSHDLHLAMKDLILNIPEEGYENYVEKLNAARSYHTDLVQQLNSDQRIIDALVSNEPVEIKADKKSNTFADYLGYLFAPVGWVTHIIPRLFISFLIKWKVKDPQFIAPLNFALGLVVYPINAILWSVLIAAYFNIYFGLAGIAIVLFSGKVTLKLWH